MEKFIRQFLPLDYTVAGELMVITVAAVVVEVTGDDLRRKFFKCTIVFLDFTAPCKVQVGDVFVVLFAGKSCHDIGMTGIKTAAEIGVVVEVIEIIDDFIGGVAAFKGIFNSDYDVEFFGFREEFFRVSSA